MFPGGIIIATLILKIVFRILKVWILLSIFGVIIFRFVPFPFTWLMFIRAFETDNYAWRYEWVSISNISPNLLKAVVYSEDQKFYTHWGFDFESIYHAANETITHNRKIGGSTITQQTAKNAFLYPARSWLRKLLEAWFTIWIELIWSKERILEVYVNVIEMGNGIYGAEAAAQYYWKKPAKKLTAREAALIAACLPNPRIYRIQKPSYAIKKRQYWIQEMMRINYLKL